jgi:hypothetical protein
MANDEGLFSPAMYGASRFGGLKSNARKRNLLLSAAVATLFVAPAHASTSSTTTSTVTTDSICVASAKVYCITDKTTAALKTSTAVPTNGTAGPSNIYVFYDSDNGDGQVVVNKKNTAVITIDSDNYVYSNGVIENDDTDGAVGIRIDLSSNRNTTSSSLENYAESTITGATVYLDSSSNMVLSGEATGKTGILLDASGATGGIGQLTGDIVTYSGSNITIKGNESAGLRMVEGVTVVGDIALSGNIYVTQNKNESTDASHDYGVYITGYVDGNLSFEDGGTVSVIGEDAKAVFVSGQGVSGSIKIEGTLATQGYTTTTSSYYSYSSSSKDKIYPEAGPALTVGTSIKGGIEITGSDFSGDSSAVSGSLSTEGIGAALLISPSVDYGSATAATPKSLVIGLYDDYYDPGFGLYNRGAVAIGAANKNASVNAAVQLVGTAALPTIIEGGIYNSGSMSASAATQDKDKSVTATSLLIDNYVYVGGSYNSTTGVYTAASYAAEAASATKNTGDKAALVNSGDTGSGTISASVSGYGGGTATAISIAATSRVSSLINSGTISAAASTNNTDIVSTLAAYGIKDLSGTLTYIYNTGTISAAATSLDSDDQIATAIDLSAVTSGMDAYNGVTIVNQATSKSSAKITGDIVFGSGNNQVVKVIGAGQSYASSISGDIYFGTATSSDASNGDLLSIAAFGIVQGSVYAESGVAVEIKNNGFLYLENDDTPLKATDLTVYNGGNISIGLTQGMLASGVINISGTATINKGANLGVAYNSYLDGGDYVLMRAAHGSLTVADLATYSHQVSTPMDVSGSGDGAKPYLFNTADLTIKTTTDNQYDELVLSVTMKNASDLGLTGYATQVFGYANTAMDGDKNLGSAMINGVHTQEQAQKAYDSFAPDVAGGTRAIAISITDQATGAVGARQNSLRMYASQSGDMTLWAQQFVQLIKEPGQGAVQTDGSREKAGFRDHGFGIALGMDAGSPNNGWYGGALTFYNGDVNEIGRDSSENQLWVVLSGYSTWRSKGMFIDAKLDVGYAHIKGTRAIELKVGTGTSETSYARYAQNSHSAALISGGVTTGGTLTYGSFTVMPQVSLDGLFLREDGYTEGNPISKTEDGDGFNLKVEPYNTKSLRAFLGASVRYDIDLWGVFLQPEARVGYRYDFLADPIKLKAAFKDVSASVAGNQNGAQFKLIGPDPSSGNFVAGASLGATTGDWSLNFHFDFVRGTNGAIEEVGTLNLIGRI